MSDTARTALVTGGARGIGHAIAKALASDGRRVVGGLRLDRYASATRVNPAVRIGDDLTVPPPSRTPNRADVRLVAVDNDPYDGAVDRRTRSATRLDLDLGGLIPGLEGVWIEAHRALNPVGRMVSTTRTSRSCTSVV